MAACPPAMLAAGHVVLLLLFRASSFFFTASPEIWQPQNIKISAGFHTTSRLDREYLRNATRHRQSENGFAKYGHSLSGKLNSMYFGPPMVKNRTRVPTHPTGGHQTGHCRASSFVWLLYLSELYSFHALMLLVG